MYQSDLFRTSRVTERDSELFHTKITSYATQDLTEKPADYSVMDFLNELGSLRQTPAYSLRVAIPGTDSFMLAVAHNVPH